MKHYRRRQDFLLRRTAVRMVWTALPGIVSAALLLLGAMAGLPALLAQMLLGASVMAAAYYILSHPTRLSVFACAGLGLLQDVLAYLPLGVGVTGWIVLHAVLCALRGRFTPEGFFMHWMLAACAFCALLSVEGAILAFFGKAKVAWDGLGTLWLLGVLLYPLLHEALHGLDRACWRRWWPMLRPG